MRGLERFRTAFWRVDRLLAIAAVALPFAVALCLGFLWLLQNGWIIQFIIVSLALSGVLSAIRLLMRWMSKRRPVTEAADLELGEVDANPEWTEREKAAFDAARRLIRQKTVEPVDWTELPDLALEVVTAVAERSGREGKKPLDFTVPEALLLIEEATSRFRTDLRRMVPFSDSVSLSTLVWLWRRRGWAVRGYDWGMKAWRVGRLVKSIPTAVLREIEQAITGGHSSFLTAEAMAVMQAVLLEEVAKAAVDLYSGRLRFSESELLAFRLSYGDVDRARLATPDAPLRILLAGQVSTGKSSLVNAMLDFEVAETDASPTTERATSHPVEIEGMDCVLVEMPGLDGGKATRKAVLDEMAGADVILWCVRANRPAREIDRAVIASHRAHFNGMPGRRLPPLVPVATCIDTLLPAWPYPEHQLPPEASETIASALRDIADDIGTDLPLPVSAVVPVWNMGALRHRLSAVMGEGLMVQRNRARLTGEAPDALREMTRAKTGIGTGLSSFGRRWIQRNSPED